MNILGKARKLETFIARKFSDVAERVAPPGPREPLEVVHAILDAVEEEVQPAGRGTHVFPFNRLKITVAAPTREARARLEALFDGSPTLHDRILSRLQAVGCGAIELTAKVSYVAQAAAEWPHPQCHVEFARAGSVTQPVSSQAAAPRQRIQLDVVNGTAHRASEPWTPARIDIGRCVEVRDHRQRLIRTNQIAFLDQGAGVNETVSRCHAHVEYHDGSAGYRVYDDRSAHGTGVLRKGRTIAVSPGSRGVRLQTGDEIVLGEARLRVTINGEG